MPIFRKDMNVAQSFIDNPEAQFLVRESSAAGILTVEFKNRQNKRLVLDTTIELSGTTYNWVELGTNIGGTAIYDQHVTTENPVTNSKILAALDTAIGGIAEKLKLPEIEGGYKLSSPCCLKAERDQLSTLPAIKTLDTTFRVNNARAVQPSPAAMAAMGAIAPEEPAAAAAAAELPDLIYDDVSTHAAMTRKQVKEALAGKAKAFIEKISTKPISDTNTGEYKLFLSAKTEQSPYALFLAEGLIQDCTETATVFTNAMVEGGIITKIQADECLALYADPTADFGLPELASEPVSTSGPKSPTAELARGDGPRDFWHTPTDQVRCDDPEAAASAAAADSDELPSLPGVEHATGRGPATPPPTPTRGLEEGQGQEPI